MKIIKKALAFLLVISLCMGNVTIFADEINNTEGGSGQIDGLAVADEPLTREEYDARGGNITEQERIASLNYYFKQNNPDKDIPTVLHLEEGAKIEDGQLKLKQMTVNINNPDGSFYQNASVDISGSYLNVSDDVVLIGEKDDNWFSESGTLTIDGLGASIYNNVVLTENVPVLILETNGNLHGFYAAPGTNSNTLVLGSKMNVCRGITTGHILTYDFGPTIPLPPVYACWGEGNKSYFQTDLLGATLSLHFDFDVDLDYLFLGAVSIEIKDNSLEFAYNNNEVHVETLLEEAQNVQLFTVEESLYEIISIGMSTFISFEGTGIGTTKFSASIKEGAKATFSFSPWDGFEVSDAGIINEQNFDILDTDMKGDFYIAYGEGPEFLVFKVVGLGASYKGGCVLEGETSKNHEYPDEPDVWHACDDDDCICGNAHIRFGPLSIEALYFGWSTPIRSTDPTDLDPFKEYYVSYTFNDKNLDGRCPHKGYKINTEVLSTTGDKLEKATVSYKDVPDHFDPVSSAKTDKDGKATLYAPTGDYNVTAELVSEVDPSLKVSQTLPIKKDENVQSLTFNLDIPVKHLYFKNSQSGQARDWPKDVDFKPFYSDQVKIPNTIPSMSGVHFVGWNTEKDGSGTSYAPGTVITARDDVILYAQWQIIDNSWYVIYNANGGTKAPAPQIVKRGEDAVITMELPEAGKMVFKGWTTNPNVPTAEYQRGDILPFDSKKNVVVLYALWDLSPAQRPVHVSFDNNGVEDAALPADLWFEMGSWAQLTHATAPMGSPYSFLGWSEDPKSTDPEFKAGKSYHFYRDVKLYAIWTQHETVTLTFKDSLSDESKGIPDPITITTNVSPNVQIPDTIPEKSGRSFVGWNTEQNGSGTFYAPGTTISVREDTTLWAQWEINESSWYVVFNANGGTKAPYPQIVKKGEDAVLTYELPENGKLQFKGWATAPKAVKADYQPGDTLPYSNDKNYVVLYALWELNPVERPVIITFDANGGKADTVPGKISIGKNEMFSLPDSKPSWDAKHEFLGWSVNPKATDPEYKSGAPVSFDKDTTLYAIWKTGSSGPKTGDTVNPLLLLFMNLFSAAGIILLIIKKVKLRG